MHMLKDVSLADHSTMRLGGDAKFLLSITNKAEIPEALAWAKKLKLPVMMIGGGSNIVWKDTGFDGLVLVNKIRGFSITPVDDETSYVTVGSGENWDKVVARTVKAGLQGIESLSLIPGTAGATPVQNVGAYGQEIADTLVSVEAYDTKTDEFVTIPGEYCKFGYRTSRFKTEDKGRFFITGLQLLLTARQPTPPFYPALQKYLDQQTETSKPEYSVAIIREAVIAIRNSKLPDSALVANNGSFFGNPIISQTQFEPLHHKYPDMPNWPTKDGKVKIPAGWLVEKAGFKNFHDRKTGMATWHAQSLVLVNEKATSTADLLIFRNRIMHEVHHKFGITLEQEPELLP